MSSTHEPGQLLEPSNLLEPLDLSEYPRDLIHPATGADRGASPQRFTRRTSGPGARKRRSFVKPILIVAGALACFGAGTALPQLQTLTRGLLAPEPTVTYASRPPKIAEGTAISDEAKPIEAKPSNESKPPANESSQAATNATGIAPAAASAEETKDSAAAQPAQAASAAKSAVADCAAPCNQQLCPKDDANCLEGRPGEDSHEHGWQRANENGAAGARGPVGGA